MELLPDGIGGSLARTHYVTSVDNDPFSTHPYTRETRLIRVYDGAVQYSSVVDYAERISMIGDAGVAYVGGNAMNVTDWTQMWTSNFEPVMALPEQHVAMHELSTGLLHEVDATGASVASGPFGGRWGYQSALGLWTEVSSTTGALSARFSLPLNKAATSFTFLGAQGTKQNAVELQRRYPREDYAAIAFLNFVWPSTLVYGVEYSGTVCREANGQTFYWDKYAIGTTEDSPGVVMEPEQCADGATTVAHVHTHPDQNYWADQYPSGYSNPQVYRDVDGNSSNGDQLSDLKIANDFWDLHPQPRYRDLMNYLAGRNLNDVLIFSRYKRGSAQLWAEDNIYKYDLSMDTWVKVLNAPW